MSRITLIREYANKFSITVYVLKHSHCRAQGWLARFYAGGNTKEIRGERRVITVKV